MAKKKPWFSNIPLVVASFACLGAMGTAVISVASFLTLPKRVEAVEQKQGKLEDAIDKIADAIQSQQIINEYIRQQEEKEVIISPDGKKFWSEDLQKWRPLDELRK